MNSNAKTAAKPAKTTAKAAKTTAGLAKTTAKNKGFGLELENTKMQKKTAVSTFFANVLTSWEMCPNCGKVQSDLAVSEIASKNPKSGSGMIKDA